MSNSQNLRKYLTEDELNRIPDINKGAKSTRDEAIFAVADCAGQKSGYAWPPSPDAKSAAEALRTDGLANLPLLPNPGLNNGI